MLWDDAVCTNTLAALHGRPSLKINPSVEPLFASARIQANFSFSWRSDKCDPSWERSDDSLQSNKEPRQKDVICLRVCVVSVDSQVKDDICLVGPAAGSLHVRKVTFNIVVLDVGPVLIVMVILRIVRLFCVCNCSGSGYKPVPTEFVLTSDGSEPFVISQPMLCNTTEPSSWRQACCWPMTQVCVQHVTQTCGIEGKTAAVQ